MKKESKERERKKECNTQEKDLEDKREDRKKITNETKNQNQRIERM